VPLAVHEVPSCTFEASLAWREILRLFPLKERWLEGDGFRLYYWTHPLYREAISTPFRDRLALVWEGAAPPSEFDFAALAVRTGCTDFVVKDVGALIPKLPDAHAGLVNDYVNSEVSLDGNIEKRFKYSARMSLRNAQQKYNLTVGINSEGIFENFYQMYLSTRRRLGVLPYPSNFFRALFELRGETVVVLSCRSLEGTIGYLVCYLHGREMISGHLVYDFEQRHKRISDFLFMSAFQWGHANGFTTYRFGADNRNQTSLIESKQKLGAVARPQWDFRLRPKLIEDLPDSPVRRLLRATPMPLFRHTDSMIKIYFA
jgi:hypothetical protein